MTKSQNTDKLRELVKDTKPNLPDEMVDLCIKMYVSLINKQKRERKEIIQAMKTAIKNKENLLTKEDELPSSTTD